MYDGEFPAGPGSRVSSLFYEVHALQSSDHPELLYSVRSCSCCLALRTCSTTTGCLPPRILCCSSVYLQTLLASYCDLHRRLDVAHQAIELSDLSPHSYYPLRWQTASRGQ